MVGAGIRLIFGLSFITIMLVINLTTIFCYYTCYNPNTNVSSPFFDDDVCYIMYTFIILSV